MNVLCSTVSMALDTVGPTAVSGPLANHADRCEACTVAIRKHEDVVVLLATLEDDAHMAPAALEPSVMRALGPIAVPDVDDRTSRGAPIAAAVATAAVAAAAAGTAVLLRLRHTRAA